MNELSTDTAPAAISGTPTTGDTSVRPTFAQAFAADAASTPEATPSVDAQTDQPAPATVAPVEPNAEAVKGPIPFDRHKAILDGAYRERDDLKAQVTQLTQQASSPDNQRLRQWGEAFARNPEQWFAQTVGELTALHPELTPALRSQAARLLGSRQQQPTAPSMDPDIPVYDESGQMVNQTFSAGRVQQIVQHAIAEALQREVTPLREDFQQRQQAAQHQQVLAEATQTATSKFEAAKAWPGFLSDPAKGTVDPDLVKAFNEHPEWELQDAYIATIVPKLRQQEQAQLLTKLKTNAAAGNTVNPAGPVVASTHKPTSLLDKSLSWS